MLSCAREPPAPPSFPTGRSSELRRRPPAGGGRRHPGAARPAAGAARRRRAGRGRAPPLRAAGLRGPRPHPVVHPRRAARPRRPAARSEEHTSELQSPCNLVCCPVRASPPPPRLSLQDALPSSDGVPQPEEEDAILARLAPQLERLGDDGQAEAVRRLSELLDSVGLDHTLSSIRAALPVPADRLQDRKSTRLNSSHLVTSYAVLCARAPRPPVFPYRTLFRAPTASPSRRRKTPSWRGSPRSWSGSATTGRPRPCAASPSCWTPWASTTPCRPSAPRCPSPPTGCKIGRAHV